MLIFVAAVGEVVCSDTMDDDMEFSGMDDQSISSSSPRCRCHRRALPLLVSPPPVRMPRWPYRRHRRRRGRTRAPGPRVSPRRTYESRIRAGRRRLRVSEQEPTSTRAAATMIAAVVVAQGA